MLLWKSCNVVLEGVRAPSVTDPDIADTLQSVPEVIALPYSLVDELIKVEVVAENDVAAHVKEKSLGCDICAGQASSLISLQMIIRQFSMTFLNR